jgi:hypothetical protein
MLNAFVQTLTNEAVGNMCLELRGDRLAVGDTLCKKNPSVFLVTVMLCKKGVGGQKNDQDLASLLLSWALIDQLQ